MIITREWSMPNSRTFKIKPIKNIIERYQEELVSNSLVLDPFSNHNIVIDRERLNLKIGRAHV